MAREKLIRVDEKEKRGLEIVRAAEYGTDEVAYGSVIRFLVNEYDKYNGLGGFER